MTGLRVQLVIGLFGCSISMAAWAEDGHGQSGQGREATAQTVQEPALTVPSTSSGMSKSRVGGPMGVNSGIESLLRLPRGFVATSPRAVAGATENEWRRRFQDANSALSEARSTLAATKLELEGVAVGGSANQWSVAPPGGGGDSSSSTSPLSFRLRQQLRGDRARIDSTEKAYRELRIAADLAGVPTTWRDQLD
jgi:hypothetical protein